ncbi:MAG TPA: hypothetical protein VFR97_13935 [Capillimicrobium sp.]|nr:hypothetical protein [Capillimicrobium sp.]
MTRTLIRGGAVAALSAALAFPAAAAAHDDDHDGWDGHRRHLKVIAGTVSSVDVAARQVVVSVSALDDRHRHRTDGEGGELRLTVRRVDVADVDGDGEETLADVSAGDEVVAKLARVAKADDGTITATAVKLWDRTTSAASREDADDDDRWDDDDGDCDRDDDDDRD